MVTVSRYFYERSTLYVCINQYDFPTLLNINIYTDENRRKQMSDQIVFCVTNNFSIMYRLLKI